MEKFCKVYDSGEKLFDRYTVVYMEPYLFQGRKYFTYLGMSENPFHPQGFGQHGEIERRNSNFNYLGKKINFDDLPLDCRKAAIPGYCEQLTFF